MKPRLSIIMKYLNSIQFLIYCFQLSIIISSLPISVISKEIPLVNNNDVTNLYSVRYADKFQHLNVIQEETSITDEIFSKTIIPFYFQDVFNVLRQDETQNPGTLLQKLFTGVSGNCTAHSLEWIYQIFNTSHLSEAETWALHMTDAWAKPPEGILSGHTSALGDYDECVGIKTNDIKFTYPNAPSADPSSIISRSFQGKYCTSFVYPRNYAGFELDNDKVLELLKKLENHKDKNEDPNSIVRESVPVHELMELMFDLNGPWLLPSFGSCFPSSCSVRDTQWFIENALKILNLNKQVDFLTFDCFVDESQPKLNPGEITMLVVLGLLIALCLLATFADYTQVQKLNVKKNKLNEAFLAFSLRKSLTKWSSTSKTSYDEAFRIECIHGLKFLTIAWIVLANTWEIPLFGYHPVWNNVDMKKIYKHWSTLLITNGNVAVDTLFTLGGFMVSLKLFHLLEKHNGKINLFVFYVRSLLRFTPTYVIVIAFIATIYPHFGSGPYSGFLTHSSQNCKTNWWTNILYVNNFVNATFENICITDSWYFANQMQFIFLTPFILFTVWKWTKFGLLVVTLLMAGSILAPGLITYDNEYLPSAIPSREFHVYFQEIYIKPWIRASPYLIGLVTAYLVISFKRSARIPAGLALAGWSLATAAALSIIFGLFQYHDPAKDIPIEEASIYAALHRFGWGLIISWIIFACSKGSGGFINSILSWKLFKPLARLTLTTYLVALPVQLILHLRFRQAITHDSYTMVNFYLADLVMSLFVAFLLTILIELPSHTFTKFIYHHEKLVPDDLRPVRERFGVFYENDVSVTIGSKDKTSPFDIAIEMNPRRRRYGIFYDETISDNCAMSARSH